MRRALLLAAALSALSVLAFAPAAFASPHGEQADGCDHGATSKPCRPDPQPDHGKDCLVHGNHGGINEDHCAEEVPTSTTTTAAPTTTTTAPALPLTGVVSSTPSTPPTAEPAPSLGCMTPEGHPYLTNPEQGGCPSAKTDALSPAPVTVLSELPATGWGETLLVFVGLWFLLGGLTALALAQLIRGSR